MQKPDFYKQRIHHFLETKQAQRKSLSIRFPFLMPLFVFIRRTQRKIKNTFTKIATEKGKYKKYINVRHQSILMRKLGKTDIKLQKNKITNLSIAAKKLDGLIIKPGEIFSFWKAIGKPNYKDGHLDGILISHGKVKVGVGGGICQMANLPYWMFLHTQVDIIERKHHSYDIFPDSGRVLPFSSGATVFFNYVDLQIKILSIFQFNSKFGQTISISKAKFYQIILVRVKFIFLRIITLLSFIKKNSSDIILSKKK